MARAFAGAVEGGRPAASPDAAPGVRGLIAGPRAAGGQPRNFAWFEASHPAPNAASEAAGRAALAEAARLPPGGRLVVLLSGGASSLLAVPAPGLTLADKVATADLLMKAGVAITGLNCVRKHLSAIKGGRLAAAAGRSLTLAISDVHGPQPDDPSVIGSGPTVGDPTTFEEARAIVREAGVAGAIPRSVWRHLEAADDESPAPGDPRLAGAEYRIVGTREIAMAGAASAARARGYRVVVISAPVTGEARAAGETFARLAAVHADGSGPVCVVASGETTVTVRGGGRGGRNQEFVLGALRVLADRGLAVLGSAGTDGIDGPTDAAGAIADGTSLTRALRAGLDPAAALAANASYDFFRALDDLIVWGPTGTNVGDVQTMIVGDPAVPSGSGR